MTAPTEKTFLRMAQVDLYAHVPQLDYLEGLFTRLGACGYNAILLCYRDKFPYTSHPDLAAPEAYTLEEVGRIDDMARRHGVEIIPLGMQFSHSAAIYKQPRYAHLQGGGGLDLLRDESVEVVVACAEDILRAHPGARLAHFGGDEMCGLGENPSTNRYIRERGASAYYVQFVNRIAARMAARGVRACVWSDMLIRYPQALPELDKSTVIFYWDYWSYGERTPFVSIGGGLPDMFMLDFNQLTGDLRKLFIAPWVHPAADLPWEHVRRFGDYWRMDAASGTIRSFPYLAWFRDNGLDVVGALTTYPEKSSFLPDFLSKFEHVRGFATRLRESGGMGFLACLWAKFFPLPETCVPSWVAATALMEHPERSDADTCAVVADHLGGRWTVEAVQGYLSAGSDFEAADLISPSWSDKPSLLQRFDWLDKAGELENDMAMCRGSLRRIEALLGGAWKAIPADVYERFVLEDMRWRAELQIAWHSKDAAAARTLRGRLPDLERRCRSFLAVMFRPGHHEEILTARYAPWRQLLDHVETGKECEA